MGQSQGVLNSFGACPMVRHALDHDRVQSFSGSGIANSDEAVSTVFVTSESTSRLTCRTSNRIIAFSHAEGFWASLSVRRGRS